MVEAQRAETKRRTPIGLLIRVLRAGAIAFVIVWLLLYFLQDRVVFSPPKQVPEFPSDLAPVYYEHWVEGSAGRLRVWEIPGEAEFGDLLAFGGNADRMDRQMRDLLNHRDQVRRIVVFEYRGYGKSEGSPSELGLYEDARSVADWLDEHVGGQAQLILWGHSLGGAVATDLATSRSVLALVLRSTFTRASEVMTAKFPLPRFLVEALLRYDFDSLSKLEAGLAAGTLPPILIFHGRNDRTVDFRLGEQLAERLGERAVFVAHDGGHTHWGEDLDLPARRAHLEALLALARRD